MYQINTKISYSCVRKRQNVVERFCMNVWILYKCDLNLTCFWVSVTPFWTTWRCLVLVQFINYIFLVFDRYESICYEIKARTEGHRVQVNSSVLDTDGCRELLFLKCGGEGRLYFWTIGNNILHLRINRK